MPQNSSVPASALSSARATRSSIRHSLNFASVGKALADVMNKSDGKGGGADKATKKTKEISSRRSSVVATGQNKEPAHPPSVDKPLVGKKDMSPETKTVTKRTTRMAVFKNGSSSSEEQPDRRISSSPKAVAPVTRASTLRPRKSSVSTSLPKYRPKSATMETIQEPPSPVRKGVRRRMSSSEDEAKEDKDATMSDRHLVTPSSNEKPGRSISPLPKRAALQVNLTTAINVTPTPSTPPKKTRGAVFTRASPPSKGPPPRPVKTAKTSADATSVKQITTHRPPSSASSIGSIRTRTPTSPSPTSSFKSAFGMGQKNSRTKTSQPSSPLRKVIKGPSTPQSTNSSPKSVRSSKTETDVTPTPTIALDSSSSDSMDADDVAFLLSSVASPTAPTPAMPRLRPPGQHRDALPETPSRTSRTFPGRSQQLLLSPIPASTDNSPLFPRISKYRESILSWDQLAATGSNSLGEDEINNMLADVPAPFASGAPSPTTANLDIPESPTLSAMPSPGGFTSISQVLLPDVTPSPAVHNTTQVYDHMNLELPVVDGAILTLLRLQLASAEELAKERMSRIEGLENELRLANESWFREEEDLAQYVSRLEEQLREAVASRDRTDEEKELHITSLREQLRCADVARESHVQAAISKTQEDAQVAHKSILVSERRKWKAASVAGEVGMEWTNVHDVAEGELEFIRASRETLAVLLAGLDHSQRQLQCL